MGTQKVNSIFCGDGIMVTLGLLQLTKAFPPYFQKSFTAAFQTWNSSLEKRQEELRNLLPELSILPASPNPCVQ